MDLDLPDELREVRRTIRAFAEEQVRPRARSWDEAGELPRDVRDELARLGVTGLSVPERYGGAGTGALGTAVVLEELARHDASLALTVAAHGIAAGHLLRAGDDAQRERWLPAVACGEILVAWALTEPGAGAEPDALRTVATRTADRWVLHGRKSFVVQGAAAGACVVVARTEGEGGERGMAAFLVEGETSGLARRAAGGRLGLRASGEAEVHLDGVEVADDRRLGAPEVGRDRALESLDHGRLAAAAVAVGLARGALEEARAYAKERKAFGQPIAGFQGIAFMLADMATDVDAARLLVHRAAAACDAGAAFRAAAAAARLFAGEAALRTSGRAVQIHGGYGYTRDFPVERYLRDAAHLGAGEGSAEAQRGVISSEILR